MQVRLSREKKNRAMSLQMLVDRGNCPAKHLQTKGREDAREREHVEHSEVTSQQLLARPRCTRSCSACSSAMHKSVPRSFGTSTFLQANGSEHLEAAWEVLDDAEFAVEQARANLVAATGEWDTCATTWIVMW
jgi:hypothetical protein